MSDSQNYVADALGRINLSLILIMIILSAGNCLAMTESGDHGDSDHELREINTTLEDIAETFKTQHCPR